LCFNVRPAAKQGGRVPDLSNPATLAAFTQLGFTGLVWVGFLFVIWVIRSRAIPFYTDKKWPADQALREKRIQAEIEARRDELTEARLMRQALEKQNAVSERLALLVEQHDQKAGAGIENIIGLLRLVLEKQGGDPATIQTVIKTQAPGTEAVQTLVQQVIEAAQKATGDARA